MRTALKAVAAAALLIAALGACGSTPRKQSDPAVRDRFAAYAGAPIDHFNWLGRFDSWQSVSRSELVVFTTPWDAYLLKLWPPCDTRFAQTIALTSTGSQVYAHLDAVTVDGNRCPIEEMRPVDYRRMRADLQRDAQPPARPAMTSAGAS